MIKNIEDENYNKNYEIEKYVNSLKDNGYLILKNLISLKTVKDIKGYIESLSLGPKERITSDNHHSLLEISNNKKVLKIASTFFKENAAPIQGLLFKYPTQQPIHQDTVHFSTFPRDLMLASWVALEDINIDNGPLEYIPNSHLIPSFSHYEYPTRHTHRNKNSISYYEQYEKEISQLIKKLKLKKSFFLAKAGDCIIWHPRLMHGGNQIPKENLTRYSYVTHYMATKTPIYFKHFGGFNFLPRLQSPKNINTRKKLYKFGSISMIKRLIKLI